MDKKKYYSCHWLNSGIHFLKGSIRFCCYEYLHSKTLNIVVPNYRGEQLDYDRYFSLKNYYKNLAKKNNIHPNCKGCIYLEEKEWDDSDFFDHFVFNHWAICNSNCIYCYQNSLKAFERRQFYSVLPVLKDMKKNNLIKSSKESCVVFGGGEPVLLKEFEDLIKLFMREGFSNIRVNSSGIKYSKELYIALQNGVASLVVSPDSGDKALYKKIKRVDKFDVVWNNLRKYSKKLKNKDSVKVKYIIIPYINDTKIEIDKFFNMVLKNSIQSVALSVETNWYNTVFPNIDSYIYDLILYFIDKAKLYGLDLELYCEAKSILEYRKIQ